jgi:hypothetical protein
LKPTLTVDERGLIVHFTNSEGEGVAIPLTREACAEAVLMANRVLSPNGKRRLLAGLMDLIVQITEEEKT